MARRLFLHVGLPKTGTTYIQGRLYARRDGWIQQGITVVGSHPLHYDAASEVLGLPTARRGGVPSGAWQAVQDEVRAATTPSVVLSNERYSVARQRHLADLIAPWPDLEVHVILTVRDLVVAEPSAWQEYVKNGGTLSWPDFCAHSLEEPKVARERRRIWRQLMFWPDQIPPERIHVVTVPPPGAPSELLFARFCSVLEVDADGLDPQPPRRSNRSLDFAATEMVRRINAHENPTIEVEAQRAEIKKWLIGGVLQERTGIGPEIPGALRDQLNAENDFVLQRVVDVGLDLVGDADDLRADRLGVSRQHTVAMSVPEDQVTQAAVEALILMSQRSFKRGQKIRRLKDKVERFRTTPPESRPTADRSGSPSTNSARDEGVGKPTRSWESTKLAARSLLRGGRGGR